MSDAAESLKFAFDKAVNRQVASDVPVSLLLSGGLDSSAVAHFALQNGARVTDAYTIAFNSEDRLRDEQSDDRQYARLMADRLGIELNVIEAGSDFLSHLPGLVAFMEDGFSDPAAISTYLISAGARQQGVKVLLSGHGADEFLGGYRRYVAEAWLHALPPPILSGFAAIAALAAPPISAHFNATGRRLSRLASLARLNAGSRVFGMYSWTDPKTLSGLLLEPPSTSPEEDFIDGMAIFNSEDRIETLMSIDRRYDLMSLNLCYTDRMSMAAGVETRVPFLDFDLVETMNAIPNKFKVRGFEGKAAFREAMGPHLPREIIKRSKAGFGLPIRAWIERTTDLFDHYLDPQRISQQGIFSATGIAELRRRQATGGDHAHTLLTLLIQQMALD